MTRRIRRRPGFTVTLEITEDSFIRPPREGQRNWLLNRAVSEFSHDVEALDRIAAGLVPGGEIPLTTDRATSELAPEEIMEDWQLPLMAAMADAVSGEGVDLLEIGFGRGVASAHIQDCGVRSHTIIECNPSIVRDFARWRENYADRDITMLAGMWQDVLPELGEFDSIFFHTYALNEDEFIEQVGQSTTFAEHFFPHAAAHLRSGGAFTYLSNEIDSLSRQHQRLLFEHFSSINLSPVRDLPVPADVRDAWWADQTILVRAVR